MELTSIFKFGAAVNKQLKRILRENTTSVIYLITGPRGAGKTQLMTNRVALALIICHWINHLFSPIIGSKLLGKPLKVWCNYPVQFWYRASDDGATWEGANIPVLLSTEDLNVKKLYTFDEDMKWGFIFIDELDRIADRQDWQNGGQKLLVTLLVQIRKFHMSLGATIQSPSWVNPRYMFQVDMTIGCRDAAMTAWGQSNGLEPGDLTFLYTQDRSGRFTGYMYEESGKTYEATFNGKHIQEFYETDKEQDPWERYETFSVKRKRFELDPFAKEEIDSYPMDVEVINNMMIDYIKRGELKPTRPEFIKAAQAKGMIMSTSEAVEYMAKEFKVEVYNKSGTFHLDFSHVENLLPGEIKDKKVEEALLAGELVNSQAPKTKKPANKKKKSGGD